MLPDKLFNILEKWVSVGWLRPLDLAFAHFLADQQPHCPDLAILAAALTSYQLGRGHICLDITALLKDSDTTLSLVIDEEIENKAVLHPSTLLGPVTQAVWEQALLNSGLAGNGGDNTPLVLFRGRIYLRRYWQYEQQVAANILKRMRYQFSTPDALMARLDKYFRPLRNSQERAKNEIHWQSIAAAVSARSGISVISGGPGTGKTTTVVRLLGVLQEIALEKGKKLRIMVAAPTGKAAARLTASIGNAVNELPAGVKQHIPNTVMTLHRLLGSRPNTRHFTHNAQNPLHADLLVVDEASMIDLEMMTALLAALPEQARLILIGDKDQLASVEAGAVLGDLCRNAGEKRYHQQTIAAISRETGYDLKAFEGRGSVLDQHITVLRKSHRFDAHSGINAIAQAVNAGQVDEFRAIWTQPHNDIAQLVLQSTDDPDFARLVINGHTPAYTPLKPPHRPEGYGEYLKLVEAGPTADESENNWIKKVIDSFNHFQIIAALRKGRWGIQELNARVADILFQKGFIPAKRGWYPGRPVMIVKNDYHLGLMNGDIGIVLPVSEDPDGKQQTLKVIFQMPDGSLKQVRPSRLDNVETVYAMTVHKSQGSEFDHTAMVLPEKTSQILTRELIYTGITRARSWFTLVGADDNLMAKAILRRTHRASGLAELLSSQPLVQKH